MGVKNVTDERTNGRTNEQGVSRSRISRFHWKGLNITSQNGHWSFFIGLLCSCPALMDWNNCFWNWFQLTFNLNIFFHYSCWFIPIIRAHCFNSGEEFVARRATSKGPKKLLFPYNPGGKSWENTGTPTYIIFPKTLYCCDFSLFESLLYRGLSTKVSLLL